MNATQKEKRIFFLLLFFVVWKKLSGCKMDTRVLRRCLNRIDIFPHMNIERDCSDCSEEVEILLNAFVDFVNADGSEDDYSFIISMIQSFHELDVFAAIQIAQELTYIICGEENLP